MTMRSMFYTAAGDFAWPSVTALVAVSSLLLGGLGGGYIENLRVRYALDTNAVVDAQQDRRIAALEDAVDELTAVRGELRDLIQVLREEHTKKGGR
jgi:hypothetical protein